MKRTWWMLTNEEAERLNPPPMELIADSDGNWHMVEPYHPDWIPMGQIPRPRTRLGWFLYHLIHGFAMRYPWWKVWGFALANTNVSREIVDIEELDAYWNSLEGVPEGKDMFAHYPISGEPTGE